MQQLEHNDWKLGTLFIYKGLTGKTDIPEEGRLLLIGYDPPTQRCFMFLTMNGNIRSFDNPNNWRRGWLSCGPEDDELKPVL